MGWTKDDGRRMRDEGSDGIRKWECGMRNEKDRR
jgi:hypothetical protein